MIQKINSKQLMETLQKSQDDLDKLKNDVSTLDSEMSKRLLLLSNEQEYALKQLMELKELIGDAPAKNTSSKILFARCNNVAGSYETFGSTVHPAFIKKPNNIFNFGSETGQIFKNNANVRINDVTRESYKNMLMHDTIAGKGIAFEEFDTPDLTLTIEVNPEDLLGSTDFNIIEMLPFIPGSFTINGIRIYSMQDYKTKAETPCLSINTEMKNFGNSRIMIDQTRTLYKCELDIHIDFQNAAGKYPFGLKHLYFLKGNYDPKSNIIFKVKKDKFIDWISEDIIVCDQNGKYTSTCSQEGIKLFMSYVASEPTYEIATSKGLSQNPIPKNINEFYVSVPVSRSMIYMQFSTIAER